MASTLTKIYLHIILAPQGEECFFPDQYKRQLELYSKGILTKNEHTLHACKVMDDHIHFLIGYNPDQALGLLIHEIKNSLEGYINANQWFDTMFEWQTGYGAFSSAQSQIKEVTQFIDNQKTYHEKHSFEQEFTALAKRFEVDLNDKDMFEF